MFAWLAALFFFLKLIKVDWSIDLVVLGLLMIALHLALGPIWAYTYPTFGRRAR